MFPIVCVLEVGRLDMYLSIKLVTSSSDREGRQTYLHERLKGGIRTNL